MLRCPVTGIVTLDWALRSLVTVLQRRIGRYVAWQQVQEGCIGRYVVR